MAAALAAAKFAGAVEVRSAGLECGPGLPAARNAVTVMEERGVDISSHSSTDVDDLDLNEFDIVVAMSAVVGGSLQSRGARRLEQWEIADPYGGDLARYRKAAEEIASALDGLSL